MQIGTNSVVSIHYTLRDETGEVLDASEGREPLDYMHGSGQIIPGLENALEGKSKGEELAVVIEPENGYGTRDESLVHEVPKSEFEASDEIEVGMQFRVGDEGGTLIMVVAGVGDEAVTLDGNHPLAGVTLSFDVSIEDVREATEEEIKASQHVHGSGCGC
ncbi:MAG: peptidylprolyl isomerase [bacterium]|nr:peptidylprolyl isomerase [bacterium]MDT8365867.1 peptidylprolyl isomerase [bacterium]